MGEEVALVGREILLLPSAGDTQGFADELRIVLFFVTVGKEGTLQRGGLKLGQDAVRAVEYLLYDVFFAIDNGECHQQGQTYHSFLFDGAALVVEQGLGHEKCFGECMTEIVDMRILFVGWIGHLVYELL